MPEGPEIRRAADSLEAAIKGEPLTDVWFAFRSYNIINLSWWASDPLKPAARRC
jgi:formamidopyrimidine-DNA glycosylase